MHRPNQSTDQLQSTKRTTPRRSRKLRTLLALGTFVGVGAVLTTAAFSDHVETTTQFTAGSFDIEVNGEQGTMTPVDLGAFTGGQNMMPGDTAVASVTVKNNGSLDANVWIESEQTLAPLGNKLGALQVQAFPVNGEECEASDFADWDTLGVNFSEEPITEANAIQVETEQEVCIGVHLPASVVDPGSGQSHATFRFQAKS